ncbi:hypothetical protein LEMLEM_LOCUS3283, partial [Lemmus lemmus]
LSLSGSIKDTAPSPHTQHKHKVCFSQETSANRLYYRACLENPSRHRGFPRPELGGPCRTIPTGALPHLMYWGMPIPHNCCFLSSSSGKVIPTISSFSSQEKNSYEDEGNKEETSQDNTGSSTFYLPGNAAAPWAVPPPIRTPRIDR